MKPRPALALVGACALALALAAGCRGPGNAAPSLDDVAYDLVISGNTTHDVGRLLRQLLETTPELAVADPSKTAVDDGAWALQEFLHEQGFPFAVVDYVYHPGTEFEDKVPRVAFQIEEGPRTRLAGLELVGVAAFPEDEVRGLFSGHRANGVEYFVRSAIDSGASALRSRYVSQGYLAVRVESPAVELSEDRTQATVRVEVEEGAQHHLREVTTSGDSALSPAELAGAWARSIGAPYTPRVAQAIRARIVEAHARTGHPDCTVEVERKVDAANGDVSLALNVDAGAKVVIGEVRVSGNDSTREGFILSRLALDTGDTYDSEKVRESFRDLYRTGLFDLVRVGVEKGEAERRALLVEVREAPSREMYVEPGFGSYEGPRLSAGILDRNVLGTGRTGTITGALSAKAREISLGATDPWLLGTRLTGTVALFYEEREEPSFTRKERGLRMGVSKDYGRAVRATLSYQFRRAELEDVDVTAAPELTEDNDVGALNLTATWERRDDLFYPTEGYRIRPSFELASSVLGSEIDFLRATHSQSHFFRFGENVVGVAYEGGIIVPLGNTTVIPLQERFFNGGENTVRSFAESQLGPLDGEGDPIGGEGYSVLSIELRRVLAGNATGALFFDAGNVVPDASDFLRFRDVRTGIGLGFRYLLPVGPVRLDVGFNPDARPGEDDYVVHLAVGMAF